MSGHSKWAQIKRQKGVADAKRGQVFTKLGRELTVAAREGGDPAGNARLRMAIQRAREANMPRDTMERAIERGSGAGEGAHYQEITYEGYGPGGTAILVHAVTDNRNRSAAEVRSTFSRNGGNLGETGCVAWLFENKGILTVEVNGVDEDDLSLQAIDAGADDVQMGDGVIDVVTDPGALEDVRSALEEQNIEITSSGLQMIPKTTVSLDERSAEQVYRLVERLEELDDVQDVFTNTEISDEVAARLVG
jgi:YebC/PmpR family DNA-binding regulatory protein